MGPARSEKAGWAVLVNAKSAGVAAPAVEALTVYWPPIALAVAVTLAWPLLPMVTGLLALRFAEAPLAGAEKVTTPPATGSRE